MKNLLITSLSTLALVIMFTGCGGGSASDGSSSNEELSPTGGTTVNGVSGVRGLSNFPAIPAIPE